MPARQEPDPGPTQAQGAVAAFGRSRSPTAAGEVTTGGGPRDPGRRRWLRALWFAGVGSVAVAVAGVIRTSGYEESSVTPAVLGRLRVLKPWQYLVVRAVARRMAAPDREDERVPTADDVDAASFVDGYLVGLSSGKRRDLVRLVGLLEHVLPLTPGGKVRRFTALGSGAQDDVLRALESSSVDELSAGFAALKALVMMAYYADPRTWRMLRYPGPFVGRPEEGFWPTL